MLKKDFLEQIKEIEDDKDIDEIILNNGFAKPLKDIDGFNELLASNKEIQGFVDGKVTQGIESFKKKGMQKIIDAEVLKRTGKEETLEEKYKRENDLLKMQLKYKDVLADKKIPSNLMGLLLGADEKTTDSNIKLFEEAMKDYIKPESRTNNKYIPPNGEEPTSGTSYESLLKNENLSLEEAMNFFANENK